MSAEFDPNKRVRETLSPEVLAQQRERAEARKRQAKPEVTPRAPRKEVVSIPKQEVDFGSENPEEGMRVRTKITDEDREAMRQMREGAKQKAEQLIDQQTKPAEPVVEQQQPPKKSLLGRLRGLFGGE